MSNSSLTFLRYRQTSDCLTSNAHALGVNHLFSLAAFANFADFQKQDSADASTYISFLCLCYVTISDLYLDFYIII